MTPNVNLFSQRTQNKLSEPLTSVTKLHLLINLTFCFTRQPLIPPFFTFVLRLILNFHTPSHVINEITSRLYTNVFFGLGNFSNRKPAFIEHWSLYLFLKLSGKGLGFRVCLSTPTDWKILVTSGSCHPGTYSSVCIATDALPTYPKVTFASKGHFGTVLSCILRDITSPIDDP